MKKLKKQLKILKILIIVVILFTAYNGFLLVGKAVAAAGVNYVTQSESFETPEATNFLLIGSDLGGNRTFAEDGVRTDVLMTVSFIPENERGNAEFNVMNIPRDVVTDYACGESGKINAAAAYGASLAYEDGADDAEAKTKALDCTIETVENMFSIPIDYYVAFDFDSFISIVDGIGGVDINNPKEYFCEQDENGVADAYCFDQGDIHLDGGAALAYARNRHGSSDYERAQRQQLIMSKILFKIMNNPTEHIDTFAKTLIGDTDNNLNIDLLLSMLNWASQTYNDTISQISSGNPFYIDIKNSPFSNDTGFDLTSAFNDGLGVISSGNYPIYDLYDQYDSIEESTTIERYMLTKNSLNLPTVDTAEETDVGNTLEIQFISLYVHEVETSPFWSWVDDYTTSYVNNQFDTAPDSGNELEESEYTSEFY